MTSLAGISIEFNRIPVAAVIYELDGTVVAVNPAMTLLVGADAATRIGFRAGELGSDLRTNWPEIAAAVRAHGEVAREVTVTSVAGVRVMQWLGWLAEVDARPVIIAVASDVTARKHAEARAAHEEQQAAKQRLESLGLVAGGIAHDFNNLLVGVLAEASATREDRTLSASARESLAQIEAAAKRMAQLTRQLLAYAGRGRFVTAILDPDALLRELRDPLARLVRDDAVFVVEPAAGELVIEADPSLMRQVLANLVANASDALPDAGGRIDVTSRLVMARDRPWWQLEVADDGVGIAPAALARVFDPFFSTKPDRHGLGLSAVQGIVRRLGGEIEVDTTPGVGTRFRVQLPVVPGNPPAPRVATQRLTKIQLLRDVRVLVADDEPAVRTTVRRLLERRGALVVMAVDGAEAETRLSEERFDLVMLDVTMPGRGGYEVLPTCRALQPGARVILMSGYTERSSEIEPDAFLEKPFTAKTLDQMIDDVLLIPRPTPPTPA